MAEITRRRFITGTTLGVGAAMTGGAAAVTQLGIPLAAAGSHPNLTGKLPESLVVHVRDLARGEVSMLVGTEEFVYQDVQLVSQLVGAAAQRGRAGR